MEHDDYTREGAHNLTGRTFASLVELPGVPRGSRGKVVEVDASGDHWNLALNGTAPKEVWAMEARPYEASLLKRKYGDS